jgi:EAL domain-containing protein (putative c-di-GMP-specific phosphodiesterase class I)
MVSDIDTTSEARSLLEATAALARSLDIPVTAEGVEREAQAQVLMDCGCDELQGYLFGKPMSADALTALLHSDGHEIRDEFAPRKSA